MSSIVASKAYMAGFGSSMVPVTAPGEAHVEAIEAAAMGKCPGRKRKDGTWFPQSVTTASCASLQEAQEWDAWGANVGIALGRDAKLIAIDSDIDDPDAARAVTATLRAALGAQHPCRGVDSPGHERFLFPVRIKGALPRGTTMVFEKNGVLIKIDILSDGKQFVAWGTHPRTGRPYKWNVDLFEFMDGAFDFPEITFERLQEILNQVTDALNELGWSKASGSVSGATAADTVSVQERRTATEYELTRWLALLPNTDQDHQFDERAAWVGLAHGIHGASEGADWGRELWLAWCNQRPQEPGQAEHVWDTLKGEGRVGLDYIREKARERNAKLAAQLDFELAPPVDEEQINAIAAGLTSGALWPHMLPRYVWVAAHDQFHDLVTSERFSKNGLDMKLGHLAEALQKEAFPNVKKLMTFSQMFALHPDTLKVDNVAYWPGQTRLVQDERGRMLVNSWRAASYKHVPGVSAKDIQTWLDLTEFVIGKQNNPELFVKYCALLIKYPGIKPNFAPVVLTPPGTGKDTTMKPVILGVGDGNHYMVSADGLTSQFTPFLESRLVYMSEMRQHQKGHKSSHDVMNDLKAYLADKPEWVGVNRKGRDVYMVRNLTGWVFFSNERKPLYVADGDRRLWIIDNMGTTRKDKAYYEKVNKWLDAKAHLVASYLMDYPLTAADIAFFKGPAPDTAAKTLLIEANRDPVEATLAEIIDEARQGATFNSCIVTYADLMAELRSRVPHVPGSQTVAMHLRALGAKPLVADQRGGAGAGVAALPDGRKQRLWVLAETDAAGREYGKLSVKDAGQVYVSAKWPTPQYQTATGTALTAINGKDEI